MDAMDKSVVGTVLHLFRDNGSIRWGGALGYLGLCFLSCFLSCFLVAGWFVVVVVAAVPLWRAPFETCWELPRATVCSNWTARTGC
jgi:hypothetical protein